MTSFALKEQEPIPIFFEKEKRTKRARRTADRVLILCGRLIPNPDFRRSAGSSAVAALGVRPRNFRIFVLLARLYIFC